MRTTQIAERTMIAVKSPRLNSRDHVIYMKISHNEINFRLVWAGQGVGGDDDVV
jgi:hypothetical protein